MENSGDSTNKSDPAAENAVTLLIIGLIIVVAIAAAVAAVLYSKMNT